MRALSHHNVLDCTHCKNRRGGEGPAFHVTHINNLGALVMCTSARHITILVIMRTPSSHMMMMVMIHHLYYSPVLFHLYNSYAHDDYTLVQQAHDDYSLVQHVHNGDPDDCQEYEDEGHGQHEGGTVDEHPVLVASTPIGRGGHNIRHPALRLDDVDVERRHTGPAHDLVQLQAVRHKAVSS